MERAGDEARISGAYKRKIWYNNFTQLPDRRIGEHASPAKQSKEDINTPHTPSRTRANTGWINTEDTGESCEPR